MKEYGGYIEFETFKGKMLHGNAIKLNSGRGALEYLCRANKIKKLYLPYFICSSVPERCKKIGVEYDYYHINDQFEPLFDRELYEREWLYIVNFYGQLDNNYLYEWKQKYGNVIVDNAQSYFQMPVKKTNTIYTCRKYFGVADGAILYTDSKLESEISLDESYERMHFLMGRYERSANEFYSEYVANNLLFAKEPVKKMSRLTENLLHGIDYKFVCACRTENFKFLHKHLEKTNKLNITISNGAFMYPLYLENGESIRKKLQKKKIYVPILWPNVLKECSPDSLEYRYAMNILPIPVDQRYKNEDMRFLLEEIIDEVSR